jgi:NAD(P)-dependent dehydrogenase (short-subunit alcohol dehydrogenase family)
MGRLSGAVILVTGASAGIGAAVAREAARQGADVVLAARRRDRLQTLAAEIEGLGRRALIAGCDVTRDGDLEAAVAAAQQEFGRIDFVIANAGFGVVGPFERLTLEDFRRQFETNVFGVLRTVMATRESLIATGGCLAIIGSVNGYVSFPGSSPYAMSKAAVHALAFTLRHELRPHGVGVTLVAPGFVKSEIRQVDNRGVRHPHARDRIPSWLSGSTEETARRILRAARKRRRVEIITGHARVAVFLERHLPGLSSQLLSSFGLPRRARHGRRA